MLMRAYFTLLIICSFYTFPGELDVPGTSLHKASKSFCLPELEAAGNPADFKVCPKPLIEEKAKDGSPLSYVFQILVKMSAWHSSKCT